MKFAFIEVFLFLAITVSFGSATLNGPYLFWGHEKIINLQPRALIEASEQDLSELFREAKAIVIFVRNNTNPWNSAKYSKLRSLVQDNAWAYLPQYSLAVEPFNYNTNIEVINLDDTQLNEGAEVVAHFNEALSLYGKGEVVGILANTEGDEQHIMSKREAKGGDGSESDLRTTTVQTPISEKTEAPFIYLAEGKKAILYVNSAPTLNISNSKETIVLGEHLGDITFDDQSQNGYGRLAIMFNVKEDKLFLRFNFTLIRGTWSMKAVKVEYKDYKAVLPIIGNAYNIPSAPLGFSYRCSSRQMIFANGTDVLVINDYQVQPWLNGSSKFGSVYDCVGFTTAPIWAGILVTLFLCSILAVGLIALNDIRTPNRFESSRSKQLTIATQE